MPIDQPLWRAAGNVADLLLADDYASIEEHEIEPLARTIWQFLIDHGIPIPDNSEANPSTDGTVETGWRQAGMPWFTPRRLPQGVDQHPQLVINLRGRRCSLMQILMTTDSVGGGRVEQRRARHQIEM